MLESWEKVLDPNFISSELIGDKGAEKVVTIKDIDFAECYDEKTKQKVQKQSVFFEECRPFVLNKTNSKKLKKLFSPNSDNPRDAIGHKVVLKVERIKAFGKEVDAIRIQEYSEEKCPVCGKAILPYAGKSVAQIKEISQRNLGEIMCGECMKNKAKENKKDE
jgi:ribosomal protein L37AE/L43A